MTDVELPKEFQGQSDKKIFEKGLALYSKKLYDQALPFFHHLKDPSFQLLKLYHLGLTYVQLGDLDKGLDYYKQIREVPPEVLGIEYDKIMYGLYINMGSTMQVLAKARGKRLYQEAIECYKYALQIQESDPRVWNNLGNAYIEMDQFSQAIDAFKKALALDAEYSEAHYSLSLAYEFSSQFPLAVKHLKEALQSKPQNKLILNRIAALEFGMGNFQEAKIWAEKVLELYPKNPTALKNLILILYNLADYAKAYRIYQQFKQIDPDFSDKVVLGIFHDLEKKVN